jgi:hypothetical protein
MKCIESIEHVFIFAFGLMAPPLPAQLGFCFILIVGMVAIEAGEAISLDRCMCFVVK